MTWKRITTDMFNIMQNEVHAAGLHDPVLCQPPACKTTTFPDSNHLFNGHQYCNKNNCDHIREIQPYIDSAHRSPLGHSNYCDQFVCDIKAREHKAGYHQGCNAFCKDKSRSHSQGFHEFCNNNCYAKHAIMASHSLATHSSEYCTFKTCPDLVISHKENHYLCRPKFCNITESAHENNDHTNCNDYWCQPKRTINNQHSNGTHSDAYCDAINCPEVAQSHQSDHGLCNRKCGIARERHESGKHRYCAGYWCSAGSNLERRLRQWFSLDPEDES